MPPYAEGDINSVARLRWLTLSRVKSRMPQLDRYGGQRCLAMTHMDASVRI